MTHLLRTMQICIANAVGTFLFITVFDRSLYKWVLWMLAIFVLLNAMAVVLLDILAIVRYVLR